MPPQQPSYGSQDYWNKRFTSNSNPFEWLEAPTALDPYLVDALRNAGDQDTRILHIGCGTSLLSYHLRAHVEDPEYIHNLDYSEVAVDLGRKRELDIFNVEEGQHGLTEPKDEDSATDNPMTTCHSKSAGLNGVSNHMDSTSKHKYMSWSSSNLLSHSSLLEACKPSSYSVIVDKSTSDSIACSEDVYVPLPYHISTNPLKTSAARIAKSPDPIHPLNILAIHLALVAKPKARWISLSYSQDRYPFLEAASSVSKGAIPIQSQSLAAIADEVQDDSDFDDDLDGIPQDVLDKGLPNPSKLWRLLSKHEIEVPEQPSSTGNVTTHRPQVLHWVYVLERTEVKVYTREN
jgi:hypothetical protein